MEGQKKRQVDFQVERFSFEEDSYVLPSLNPTLLSQEDLQRQNQILQEQLDIYKSELLKAKDYYRTQLESSTHLQTEQRRNSQILTQRLEDQVHSLSGSLNAVLGERDQLVDELSQQNQRFQRTQAKHQTLVRELREASDREFNELNERLARLRKEKEDLNRQLHQLNEEKVDKSLWSSSCVKISQLENELLMLRQNQSQEAAQVLHFKSLVESQEKQIAELQQERERTATQWAAREASLLNEVSVRKQNESRLEAQLVQQVGTLEKQREAHSTIIHRHEQRIESFLATVRNEASQLRRKATEIFSELQQTMALHPINDLIKATDNELQRLEAQLVKTPTISVDRSRLESSVLALREQRRYLAGLLADAQSEFQAKDRHLKGLMQDLHGFTVPPLPPRSDLDSK